MNTQAFVACRFDSLQARFKTDVACDDARLVAVTRALGPLAGKAVLDVGCGKGRFARHWAAAGARVVGLDASAGMLNGCPGLPRVLGSASSLPFGSSQFDSVVAIEVVEHLTRPDLHAFLASSRRVLKPGGRLLIVDKNALALDARRPWLPAAAVKWLDERRGRWMYQPGEPFRERWFIPGQLASWMRQHFDEVRVEHLRRGPETGRAVFERLPWTRLWTLWQGRALGDTR